MSRQANPAVIGGFVLGALLLFVAALIVFGSGALLRERIALVTFFPGSVLGLGSGAQVQFQGVPIGQVTSIGLDYLPDSQNFRVPVRYDVWPRNVDVLGGMPEADARTVIRHLVEEQGLRARLEPVSLVTGQYVVTLSLNPHIEPQVQAQEHQGAIQVPALEATRDRIEDLISDLPLQDLVSQASGTLEGIHALFASGKPEQALTHLNQAVNEARLLLKELNQDLPPLIATARATLADYQALAVATREQIEQLAPVLQRAAINTAELTEHLQGEWIPLTRSARAALDQGTRTLQSLDALVATDSPTRYRIEQLLRESTAAARSIRVLADYLERHPEALLKGKDRRHR